MYREVRQLRQQIAECQQSAPLLIGHDPKMQAIRTTIEQIAPTDCNVLILSEIGTGKELVARTIHQLSLRAEKRFLAIIIDKIQLTKYIEVRQRITIAKIRVEKDVGEIVQN